MGADAGYTKPTNQILVAGQPLVQILKIKTADTNCLPGRLVMKDTTDGQIKASDGSQFIGWLGYEQTIKKYRPADVDTAYSANYHVAVLNGGGFVIVASLSATCPNIAKGALLQGVADGELSAGTAGSHHIVAIAEESTSRSTGAQDIMVRSLL